jgi:xanthine dehydrogenase YagS FAD-binding subunit
MCYRGGGNICYADTPTAMNREHAIFPSDRCAAVNPSDVAPALIALDAKMVIRSLDGERVVAAEHYFLSPANDITRTTVLGPADLLIAIRIPNTWAGATFYFEKARERKSWDFPLVTSHRP